MSSCLFVRKAVVGWCLALLAPALVHGQASFLPQAGEYPIAGSLPGEQVYPDISLNLSGGYIVWQDNITDGEGYGISARRLDNSLSGVLSTFRVNQVGVADQERPHVSMLKNGGAAFVWQGGKQGYQHIYGRFLSAAGTWETGDVLINTYTNSYQLNPAIATLTNGNVVVIWSSINQEGVGSMQGVYAQRLSPVGQKLGSEFRVNQFTDYNQRSASIAALSDGRFVVVWISEQQRFENSVDVYARLYSANGAAVTGEFLINTGTNVCANPTVAASPDGGFTVAWAQKDVVIREHSWDIFARPFSAAGVGGVERRLNTQLYGDQFAPRISSLPVGYLVVWTSMGQDGSREGVFGQFLNLNGTLSGEEIRINTTTVSQQLHPMVASDGGTRFLAAWTSFVGGGNGFDLFAQRYATVLDALLPPEAPYVSVLSSNSLGLAWGRLDGFNVTHYEVFVNGAATPTLEVTDNWHTFTGLTPSTTYSFRIAYVLSDGRRSPLSASVSGTTYGTDTWGGVPLEWMRQHFGADLFAWPSPFADSDGDGVSNRDEFLQGTNPNDANSVLRQRLENTAQGLFLVWNTQPGLLYQVQTSSNLQDWTNLGGPRFAAGTTDSLYVGGGANAYYRVLRVR